MLIHSQDSGFAAETAPNVTCLQHKWLVLSFTFMILCRALCEVSWMMMHLEALMMAMGHCCWNPFLLMIHKLCSHPPIIWLHQLATLVGRNYDHVVYSNCSIGVKIAQWEINFWSLILIIDQTPWWWQVVVVFWYARSCTHTHAHTLFDAVMEFFQKKHELRKCLKKSKILWGKYL